MTIDFTVVIPAYNGAERLPLVLDKLRSQLNPSHIRWEVIIVDNNSSDNTAALVPQWQDEVPLRYSFEPRQGIAFARQRGVEEAQGAYIGFLDDDNFPAADWVSQAYLFGQTYPQVGAYGSQIQAELEGEPPEHFEKVQSFLVIRNYSKTPKPYEPEKLRLPAGAGLVVRKQAWLESVPNQLVRTGRGGNDYEISLHMHTQGWEIWHNPAMKISHHIPAWRMEKQYLCKLARLYGLCTCDLLMITVKPWHRPWILLKNLLGSLRRVVVHQVRYHQQMKTDLGLACEMAFFMGGLMSPFYYLNKHLFKFLSGTSDPTPSLHSDSSSNPNKNHATKPQCP
jgi:glycosyltransferase involved in cell wall biosynthesis